MQRSPELRRAADLLEDAAALTDAQHEALVEVGLAGGTEAAYKEFTAKYAALVADTDESQPPEMCRE
jgi:hypothetical protein